MTLIYGQLDPLYDAVRARAPMVDAARCYRSTEESGTPVLFLRVGCGANGPWRVVWDDQPGAYRWDSGPDAGAQLGRDVDQVAEAIAWALGAPTNIDPPGARE